MGANEGVLILHETEPFGLSELLGADQHSQSIDSLEAFAAAWGYPCKGESALAPFLRSASVPGEHSCDQLIDLGYVRNDSTRGRVLKSAIQQRHDFGIRHRYFAVSVTR
jgi:hypothetical protein